MDTTEIRRLASEVEDLAKSADFYCSFLKSCMKSEIENSPPSMLLPRSGAS